MPQIRISLMRAKPGHAEDVARIMGELLTSYRTQPGYIDGYLLRSADSAGDIGRVTIWSSEAATDAAAQTAHVLSERSELLPLIEEESHVERSFEAEQPAAARPPVRGEA
jgi:quinol monooxygenase YgiN